MSKRVIMVGAAILLGGACKTDDYADLGCPTAVTTCRVVPAGYGYQRACVTECFGSVGGRGAADDDGRDGDGRDDDGGDDDRANDDGANDESGQSSAPIAAESDTESLTPPSRNVGAAPAPDSKRYSAFESPCERDSQCGPGKCQSGSCYYGCQSDAQCGSGDRCSVESGVRVCMPDPNPPVVCTRSAQCDEDYACLNGGCRQTCTSTEQCTNLLDRCAAGLCVPDRRPLGECVVNSECADGLVCLDGACVPACPAEEEAAGVCLADSSVPPLQAAPEAPTPTNLPTPSEPEAPTDDGEAPPSDGDDSDDGDTDESATPGTDDGEATGSADDDASSAPDDGDEPVADEGGAGDEDDSEPESEESSDPDSDINGAIVRIPVAE